MKITKHIKMRMSQRAINQDMVDLTMKYGEVMPDGKVVLSKKATKSLMDAAGDLKRKAQKAYEKGGLVVVCEDGALITTYRLDSYLKSKTHGRNLGLQR